MIKSLDSYSNDYYKEYMKGYRKSRKDENMIDEKSFVEFKSKKISVSQFKSYYKNKLKNKEQEYIFNNCLDLIILTEECKKAIEKEGSYYKNTTGNIKINPLVKELRENLKAFTNLLSVLHNLQEPVETETKAENRFMKFAK